MRDLDPRSIGARPRSCQSSVVQLRAICFAFAVVASACALETPVLEVPLRDAESVLVVTIDTAELATITAFDVDPGAGDYFTVPIRERELELYVLHYDCTLAALSLAAGTSAALRAPEEGFPLPDAARVFTATISGDRATPIAESTALPTALVSLRLAGDDTACVDFTAHTFEVPDTLDTPVMVLLPLGGDRAFVATRDARTFIADTNGLVEGPRISTTASITGGFRAGDGELFFAATNQETFRGRVETGFVPGPRTVSAQGFLRSALSGDPSGPLSELFLVDGVKSFERLAGGTFTRIDDGRAPLDYDRPSVVWLGPGHAVAAGLNVGPLARYRDGRFSGETLPIEDGERVRAMRFFDRWDLLIATSEGRILQHRDGGYDLIHEQVGGLRVLAPIDRGVISGGGNGTFVQLHRGFAPCIAQLANRDVGFIAELENGFAIATDLELGTSSAVTVLLREKPARPMRCAE